MLDEAGIEAPVLYSEDLKTSGAEMFEAAARLNLEGIVSKRAVAPYRSDRNEGWLKIKCSQRGQFPVVGFVKDPGGIAALYLGKRVGKELPYVGRPASRGRCRPTRGGSWMRWRREVEADDADPEAEGDLGGSQTPRSSAAKSPARDICGTQASRSCRRISRRAAAPRAPSSLQQPASR